MIKWFERLCNRLFTHNRDEVGDYGIRMVIHIPLGFLLGLTHPFSGDLKDIFIRYEENEDVHCIDQAWKDYAGIMVGQVIAKLLWIAATIYTVNWLVNNVIGEL